MSTYGAILGASIGVILLCLVVVVADIIILFYVVRRRKLWQRLLELI